jgi:hypothetical protein
MAPTYLFNPSAADVVLNAFGMLQIRRHELTTAHLEDASLCAGLLMVDMSNRAPHRWLLEAVSISLTAGVAAYTLPARTLAVPVATLTSGTGGNARDRTLSPLSAADYAMQPNKLHAAPPTSYWFSLTSVPTITLWPVPTATSLGPLNLQTFRQVGDVALQNGATMDAPYRFLDAITTGLAARLAQIYRPEAEDKLNARYEQRVILAAKRDEEDAPMRIIPDFSGYYR